MTDAIRPATPEDAEAIAAVAAEVWPDEVLDATAIGRAIAETARGTSVAVLDGKIVGFVDGFVTKAVQGESRWEVDLLAVSPKAQVRGFGRALVRASVDAGIAAGIAGARGLIRVGNVASERVFGACGFVSGEAVSQLWIAETLDVSAARGLMHAVPVRTFRYEGCWLEAVTAEGLAALRREDSAGVIGAVIPVGDHVAIAAASAAGMRLEGEFRFWQRHGRS